MYPYPTAVNQHLREVCLNTEFQSTALYWKDISTNSEQIVEIVTTLKKVLELENLKNVFLSELL